MGAQIRMARWTPAWFATGGAMLCLALALWVAGYGPPMLAWEAGESRAVLHLLVLGWLGTMMIGASLQFVPVLTAVPVAFECLSPLVLSLWTAGTLCLCAGFWRTRPDALLAAVPLLTLAAFLAFIMLFWPVLAALRRERLVWMLGLGLLGMVAVIVLGAGFALALSGSDLAIVPQARMRATHAFLGLGGWFGVTAMAVSLKFLSMFGLTQAADARHLAFLALASAGAMVFAPVPSLSLAFAAVAVAIYIATGLRMLRARKINTLDMSMRGGVGAAAVLPVGLALSAFPTTALAGGILLALGWLSLLTLSFMPKIMAFLTWMEVFGPLIGRASIPPTSKLTSPTTLRMALVLWGAGVAALVPAVACGAVLVTRLSALALLLAAVAVLWECRQVRRLAHVSPEARPGRPALFLIQS